MNRPSGSYPPRRERLRAQIAGRNQAAQGAPHAAAWTVAALGLLLAAVALGSVPTGTVSGQPDAERRLIVATPHLWWNAAPGTRITGTLSRRGRTMASVQGATDGEGRARLQWATDAGPARQMPGDRLTIYANDDVSQVRVPELLATVDVDAAQVVGHAPPDTPLHVVWDDGSSGPTVASDAAGTFHFQAQRSAGRVSFIQDRVRFEAAFHAPEITWTVGLPMGEGRASPGDEMAASQRRIEMRVDNDPPAPPVRYPVTRVFPAGPIPVGDDGTPDRPGRYRLPLRAPIVGGDMLTLTRISEFGGDVVRVAEAPTLTAAIESNRRVSGLAPPGADISLLLQFSTDGFDPLEELATVTADDAGAWRYDADLAMQPGSLASATIEGAQQTIWRAIATVPRTTALVHGPTVYGMGHPGGNVRVSLERTPAVRLGPWQATADSDGAFRIRLSTFGPADPEPIRIQPGEILWIELAPPGAESTGDPIRLPVPSLEAVADPDARTVRGSGPPGESLTVWTIDDDRRVQSSDVRVPPDGSWEATLPTPRSDDRAWTGGVTWRRGDGHGVVLPWASTRMTASLDSPVVHGLGAPGHEVSLSLLDDEGTTLATGAARIIPGEGTGDPMSARGIGPDPGAVPTIGTWKVELWDTLGRPVSVRAGDRLQASIGSDTTTLNVPELDGVVHVADDLVAGETAPSTPVHIELPGTRRRGPLAVETTSDPSGLFARELRELVDLAHNDVLILRIPIGQHWVRRVVDAPGLHVDLDRGEVRGSVEPGVDAAVSLIRDGQTLALATVPTEEDATFQARLRAADGRPPSMIAGDRIEVRATSAIADRQIGMDVPRHVVSLPAGGRRITGTLSPTGLLSVTVAGRFPDGIPRHVAAPSIARDGSWSVAVDREVEAGTTVTATARMPSGHFVTRGDSIPVVNVRLGGATVCGHGPPGERVVVDRPDDGSSAVGVTDGRDGTFSLSMRHADGTTAILRSGDRLRTTIGSNTADVSLPLLGASVDWTTGEVVGDGPSGGSISFELPGDCRGAPVASRLAEEAIGGRGRYRTTLSPDDIAGGLQIATRVDGGHRVFRLLRPNRAWMHVYDARVTGSARPDARIAITLTDGIDPSVLFGTARTRADGTGWFDATLTDADGERVLLQPGHRLVLVFGDSTQPTELYVSHLEFDFDPQSGVQGTTDPQTAVRVELLRAGGEMTTITRMADEVGRWAFTEDDVPARAGWSLADVVGVRASYAIEGGHRIVRQTPGFDALRSPPGSRAGTVYLPTLARDWEARVP